MQWIPAPGDRVKTILTKDKENEVVYLNGDHAIETTISDEFLTITGEWVPWSHQIIDYLSRQRGQNKRTVLLRLIEFEALHIELDFDQLCLLFLEQVETEQSKSFFQGYHNARIIEDTVK
jgi:hypothetical protein